MIKDFVKKHRILLDSARRVRCFITACKWIYIRIWTKIPCKLIRNLIINTPEFKLIMQQHQILC